MRSDQSDRSDDVPDIDEIPIRVWEHLEAKLMKHPRLPKNLSDPSPVVINHINTMIRNEARRVRHANVKKGRERRKSDVERSPRPATGTTPSSPSYSSGSGNVSAWSETYELQPHEIIVNSESD